MKKFYTPVDFLLNEINNVNIAKLGSAPTAGTYGVPGQIVFAPYEGEYVLYMCTAVNPPVCTWKRVVDVEEMHSYVRDYVMHHSGALKYCGVMNPISEPSDYDNGWLWIAGADGDAWWDGEVHIRVGDMIIYTREASATEGVWNCVPLEFSVEQVNTEFTVNEDAKVLANVDGTPISLKVVATADDVIYDSTGTDIVTVKEAIDRIVVRSFAATTIGDTLVFDTSGEASTVIDVTCDSGMDNNWAGETTVEVHDSEGSCVICDVRYDSDDNEIVLTFNKKSDASSMYIVAIIHAPDIYHFAKRS